MRAGTVIADRFELERLVGSGGMGEVWRAADRLRGRPAALKLVHAGRAALAERLEIEAEVLTTLRHPTVVGYLDHGRAVDGRAYLAMEWLDGTGLDERLARAPLALSEVVLLGGRVADALGAAHAAGVVHRDVKPSNLLLVDGRADGVKLLDFGLAKTSGQLAHLAAGLAGTPGYLAPEQARGESDVDARADVFALGCVLFECIAGRPAFGGGDALALLVKILLEDPPSLSRLRPDVPPALSSLVARMLSKQRDQRPADGSAVSAELATMALPAPSSRPRTSLPSPPLGEGERRLLCVLIVGADAKWDPATAPTLEAGAGDRRLLAVRVLAEQLGGLAEPLLDGSVVITLSGNGRATDRALAAARMATRVRDIAGSAPMALATGLAESASTIPVGEAIERAVALSRRPAARGEVWVDEVTAGLISSRWEVATAPAPHLRAERQSLGAMRTLLGETSPFVGRAQEVGAIAAAFEACRSHRRAGAVLVTGEAGAGKSRLAAEVAALLQQEGALSTVVVGRADPLHAGSPFALLADSMRRALRVHDDDPPSERRARLHAAVAELLPAPQTSVAAEFLAELLDVADSSEQSEQLIAARSDPVLMGDRMRGTWQAIVEALCRKGPVLLLLEDVHWADASSIGALHALLDHPPEVPLMVLALARPEARADGSTWARAALSIELTSLPKDAGEKMVRVALPDVSREQLERLLACAEGNPFHLEELVRAEREGYASSDTAVMAVLHARIETFPAEARRVLRAGSVFGQSFQASAVLRLLASDPAALAGSLRLLERREVLIDCGHERYSRGDEYRFRHPLLRDAAYRAFTSEDRCRGHRLAAEWLEQAAPGDPRVIAEHFEDGQDPGSAAGWFARAVEQSLEGNDFGAAIDCADRAAHCGATGEVLGSARFWQASAHVWRGESEAALRCAEEAISLLAPDGPLWWSAVAEAAAASVRLLQLDRLAALVHLARSRTPGDPSSPTYLSAMARLAHALIAAGNARDGRAILDDIAEAMGAMLPTHPALAGRWYETRGALARDAVADQRRAVEAYLRAGDERRAARVRVQLSDMMLDAGCAEEAELEAREALRTSDRLGLSYLAPGARVFLGLALSWMGRTEEARAQISQATRACQEQGDRFAEAQCRVVMAQLELESGAHAAAEVEARAALASPVQRSSTQAVQLATLSRSLVGRRPEEALEHARAAVALAPPECVPAAQLALAEASLALGDEALARAAVRDALTSLRGRAAQLDPDRRVSFFARIPLHARIAELARDLACDDPQAGHGAVGAPK